MTDYAEAYRHFLRIHSDVLGVRIMTGDYNNLRNIAIMLVPGFVHLIPTTTDETEAMIECGSIYNTRGFAGKQWYDNGIQLYLSAYSDVRIHGVIDLPSSLKPLFDEGSIQRVGQVLKARRLLMANSSVFDDKVKREYAELKKEENDAKEAAEQKRQREVVEEKSNYSISAGCNIRIRADYMTKMKTLDDVTHFNTIWRVANQDLAHIAYRDVDPVALEAILAADLDIDAMKARLEEIVHELGISREVGKEFIAKCGAILSRPTKAVSYHVDHLLSQLGTWLAKYRDGILANFMLTEEQRCWLTNDAEREFLEYRRQVAQEAARKADLQKQLRYFKPIYRA